MGTQSDYSLPASGGWRPTKPFLDKLPDRGAYPVATSKNILRNYIDANGGPSGMARKGGGGVGISRAGLRTAASIGGFVTAVKTEGLDQALTEIGLSELIGKSAREIIYGLIDKVGGEASSIDDEDARNAQIDLWEDILEDATTADDVEAIFTEIYDENKLAGVIMIYLGLYIFQQFCRLEYKLVSDKVGDQKASNMFAQVKDYIRAELERCVSQLNISVVDINWQRPQGIKLCRQVLENTLYVFHGDN